MVATASPGPHAFHSNEQLVAQPRGTLVRRNYAQPHPSRDLRKRPRLQASLRRRVSKRPGSASSRLANPSIAPAAIVVFEHRPGAEPLRGSLSACSGTRMWPEFGGGLTLSRLEPRVVDPKAPDLVIEDTVRRVEETCRFGAIASRRLERVLNQVALIPGHRIAQRDPRD